MIFNRPIHAPNVILVDLNENQLNEHLAKIISHISFKNKFVGVNTINDNQSFNHRAKIIHQPEYEIYRDAIGNEKDISTIFIKSGLSVAYFLDTDEENCRVAFSHMYDLIGEEYPIILVSNYFQNQIDPCLIITDKENFKSLDENVNKVFSIDEFFNAQLEFSNQLLSVKAFVKHN